MAKLHAKPASRTKTRCFEFGTGKSFVTAVLLCGIYSKSGSISTASLSESNSSGAISLLSSVLSLPTRGSAVTKPFVSSPVFTYVDLLFSWLHQYRVHSMPVQVLGKLNLSDFDLNYLTVCSGLIVTMIILGLGTGGIKSNVSPLIAEQYTETRPRVKVLESGEKVIIDPAVTIQSIYNIFYWCINIGSLSAIATTYLELYIDFWAAYLLPFCVFFFAPLVLWIGKKKYVVRPPKGSILLDAGNALWIAARNGFRLEAATDQYGEQFIAELQRALVACRVFAFYPAFWLLYGQMNTSFVSMAGTMETHGLPNDFLINLNPISIIIFIPLVEKGLYPMLRKLGISFKPITRIFVGFLCISLGMAYAAGIQKYVYMQGPCYDHPLECAASMKGEIPNRAHVALQTPVYVLTGFGEIFAAITGLEYAFTKAPPSMKSFVTAIYLLQNAFGSAIGIGVSSVAHNPNMVTFFAALSGVTVVCGFAFFALFRKHNKTEETMNRLDADNEEFKPRPPAEIQAAKEKISEP